MISPLLAIFALAAPPAETTLVVNAVVVDGTGAPGRRASVRIADGRILAVGALAPARGDRVVDARGLVLARRRRGDAGPLAWTVLAGDQNLTSRLRATAGRHRVAARDQHPRHRPKRAAIP